MLDSGISLIGNWWIAMIPVLLSTMVINLIIGYLDRNLMSRGRND